MSTRSKVLPTPGIALGKHMTIEYYDCDPHILADAKLVEDAFIRAAQKSGATVIGSDFHYFEPQGVSGFVVIAESHFSVHAWPEFDYAAVDIFTCGESIDFQTAVNTLKDSLKADAAIISSVMNRGITANNGVEKLIPVFEDKTHLYSLSWKTKYEKSNAWGLSTNIDIYDCDAATIRNPATLRRFAPELCRAIDIPCSGDSLITPFGEKDPADGFCLVLMDGASQLTGRFSNATGAAYLDVFSCKYYEPRDAAEFAISFFQGSNYRMQVTLRR